MKRVLYSIGILLAAAATAGCAGDPAAPVGDPVAVELVATGESAQVSRAADMDAVDNAVIVVFKGGAVDQCKYVDYTNGGRVYLKRGETYQVFAVANLTDANCPNGSAAEYLDGVTSTADLDGLFLLAAGAEPDNLIMCSELKSVTVPASFPTAADAKITLDMYRVQTKIELNIYNKTDGAGNVASGVELYSYHTNSLPGGSWLREQATDRASEEYWETYPILFSALAAPVEKQVGSAWYYQYAPIEVITFESRRGTVDGVASNMYDRKSKAPANAFEVNIIGYANSQVLNTYVLPGQGRGTETASDTGFGDYNIERNCVYHVNVYINSTDNITSDSRRVSLGTVVCGDLESPGEGDGADF